MKSLEVPGTMARGQWLLRDIRPSALATFLETVGWIIADERKDAYQLWVSPDGDIEALVPFNLNYRDFQRRFAEALEAVSDVTGLQGEALALEIGTASSDVMLLRADRATPDGTIPLSEAQTMLEGAEKMLSAAACSAIRPRATVAGRRPDVVRDFMSDGLRMGHTLRGSFVMTIYAPVNWSEDQGSRNKHDDSSSPVQSFGRVVLNTVASGLDAAREMLREELDFERAVSMGVSAEFLDGLGMMGDSEGLRGLDFSFRWSKGAGSVSDEGQGRRLLIKRDEIVAAPEFAKRLRKRAEPELRQIVGYVRRLERGVRDDDGTAIVEGTIDGLPGTRTVRVPLSGGEYTTAIRAHEQRSLVALDGSIQRRGRSLRIEGESSISVLQPGGKM